MSTKKVYFIIGEGVSEKSFFSSLFSNKLGFNQASSKHPYLYTKGVSTFCFFPFPPPGTGRPQQTPGGNGRFHLTRTYHTLDALVDSHSFILDPKNKRKFVEVHYNVLRDTDAQNLEKLKKIQEKIKKTVAQSKITHDSFTITFVNKCLESWYIAGMPADFPHLIKSDISPKNNLLTCDPEEIKDPKAFLKSFLHPDIRDQTIMLGNEMGQYFDIEAAVRRSKSFKKFYEDLKNRGIV